jgi:hypothetical protein
MAGKRTLLFAALALGAAEAAATTLTVTRVDRSRPGWVRIALEYAGDTPTFRLTAMCDSTRRPDWLVASIVTVLPRHRQASIAVRASCAVQGVAVEMVEGEDVVADAEIPLTLPEPPPLMTVALPADERTPSRLGVVGRKYAAPQTRMTEAGVVWSVSDRLSLHLSYERTAFAPVMSKDHDDGILTGLKLGF